MKIVLSFFIFICSLFLTIKASTQNVPAKAKNSAATLFDSHLWIMNHHNIPWYCYVPIAFPRTSKVPSKLTSKSPSVIIIKDDYTVDNNNIALKRGFYCRRCLHTVAEKKLFEEHLRNHKKEDDKIKNKKD